MQFGRIVTARAEAWTSVASFQQKSSRDFCKVSNRRTVRWDTRLSNTVATRKNFAERERQNRSFGNCQGDNDLATLRFVFK